MTLKSKHDFEVLFKTHYNALCLYALKFLKDHDLSEEIVQSVFVNIWQKKESLQISSSIKSYLFQSVRNACYNHFMHTRVKESHYQYSKANNTAADDTDTMQVMELEQKIFEAIDKIPTERKRIFELSRFEGKKYREIADELNLSIKTVENQMGKALKFLREELRDYMILIISVCLELLRNII